MADAVLVEAIRQMLIDRQFHGEDYRKVWARLRHAVPVPGVAAGDVSACLMRSSVSI
jgi:hypothetical protein